MPNNQVLIGRELLEDLRDLASDAVNHHRQAFAGYKLERQASMSATVERVDEILSQPEPADGVEVVSMLDLRVEALAASPWAKHADRTGAFVKGVLWHAQKHNAEVARLRGEVERWHTLACNHSRAEDTLRTELDRANALLANARALVSSSTYKINGATVLCSSIDAHLSRHNRNIEQLTGGKSC